MVTTNLMFGFILLVIDQEVYPPPATDTRKSGVKLNLNIKKYEAHNAQAQQVQAVFKDGLMNPNK